MNRTILPLLVLAALAAAPVRAADADATGLVPTIWWDFETKPSASGLATANKGSASISFTSEGTATYQTGVTNGWALDTSKFTPYSGAGSFSTAGNPFTLSLVMTLGTKANGITLNLRTTAGDLIVRRGADAGSLVVGWGAQQAASSQFLNATFVDGDAAFHLVSVVGSSEGTELYVDGELADSSSAFTPWSASGKATQMQFGSHLNSVKAGEAKNGGLIDDLRIHDAALTPAQIKAIGRDVGLLTDPPGSTSSGRTLSRHRGISASPRAGAPRRDSSTGPTPRFRHRRRTPSARRFRLEPTRHPSPASPPPRPTGGRSSRATASTGPKRPWPRSGRAT